nr:uncharacterized protein LOC110079944 isoform X2 [Pogona vitticeps]
MEMEATDQATSSRLRPRQTDKEILSEFDGSSKEDEDFLAGLNPEEKECLEYFLQTISALDEDISEEVLRTKARAVWTPACSDRRLWRQPQQHLFLPQQLPGVKLSGPFLKTSVTAL